MVQLGRNLTPAERARLIADEARREGQMHQWERQGAILIQGGYLLPSSFIEELRFTPNDSTGIIGKVHAQFGRRWYTFLGVKKVIFDKWRKGAATCITDDTSGAERWLAGKSPSMGAFFNHIIRRLMAKGEVTCHRGQL